MKPNFKICFLLLSALFLFFRFSNHALAWFYDVPNAEMKTGCNNPFVSGVNAEAERTTLYQVFCNGDYWKTIGTVPGGGETIFYTLGSYEPVSYYLCSTDPIFDGSDAQPCNATSTYEDLNKSLEQFQISEADYILGDASGYYEYNNAQIFLAPDFYDLTPLLQSSTTPTSTNAMNTLDTIGGSIFNTVIYFVNFIIGILWPFILVFALLAGFATAIMLFFKKIIK